VHARTTTDDDNFLLSEKACFGADTPFSDKESHQAIMIGAVV
jgi:hypothetical protein